MDDTTLRNQAFHWAIESHPLRFNSTEKPSLEDLIERAAKIAVFLKGDQAVGG